MRSFKNFGVVMKLIVKHAHWMILELLRAPAYVVATIAFPALFYMIFAVPESNDAASSNMLVASFSCFSVFGVMFLQFGVGVSQERSNTWYLYLKTLPLHSWKLIAARFLSAIFFSLLASLGIILLSLIFTKVNLSLERWIEFIVLLHLAGVIFCFMGLALGLWASEKSSLPIGNLIYLPLSFAGGLWKPPSILPEIVQDASKYLPTRHYGEVMWSFVSNSKVELENISYLLAYMCMFALVSFIGFRKEQSRRGF
ncbi:MAG: ABC transporter [Halobacteriovoraceae bacterium]|nr:ABC transporter [Halobacteriovoraceae bacterium]